jgi:RNA recognition motif. (a.k.a. RRM, RBD, or RNP domain)
MSSCKTLKSPRPESSLVRHRPSSLETYPKSCPSSSSMTSSRKKLVTVKSFSKGKIFLILTFCRPALKYFYYAFCRFPDIIQARRLLNDIKFPELHGKVCRALPYDKELLRSCEPKSNVFVKGFSVHWSHKDLHKAFEQFGQIVSSRVSIKDNYESRGFGFVQFANASSAEQACQVVSTPKL